MSGFADGEAAKRFARDVREASRNLLQAERRLSGPSVVDRNAEPLAQFIDKRLDQLGNQRLTCLNGSAALQVRLFRRRLRGARKVILNRGNVGNQHVLDSHGECEVRVHSAAPAETGPKAMPAAHDGQSLSDAAKQTSEDGEHK